LLALGLAVLGRRLEAGLALTGVVDVAAALVVDLGLRGGSHGCGQRRTCQHGRRERRPRAWGEQRVAPRLALNPLGVAAGAVVAEGEVPVAAGFADMSGEGRHGG